MNPRLRFKRADGTDYPDWEEKKLGDICKTFSGGTPRTGVEEYYNGNINFIRSGEIHNSKTELFISEEGLKNSSAKLVNVGDILLALYGATSGEIDLSKINGAINQAILCIRPQEGFNKKFIVESFRYNKNNILKFYLQGGQGNLSAQNILKLKFPFPCLEEQEKIADCLSSFDNLISIYNEQLKTLQEQKKGIMQKLFSQEVRFKKADGTDYPNWEEKKLGDILTQRREIQTISEEAPLLAFTIEDGVIDPKDKKTNKRDFLIKDKESKKFQLTKYDDIIYNPANIKFGAIHRNKFGQGVVSPIYVILTTNQNPCFLENYFKRKKFLDQTKKYLEGTVEKLRTLKPENFLSLSIKISCLEEQEKIADCLSAFDEAIKIKKEQIKTAKDLKKGLLQQMFT